MVNFKLDSSNIKLSEEERRQLDRAKAMPIIHDEDSPELSEEMELAFFAARKAKPYKGQPITVYVSQDTADKARSIGENSGAILGQILDKIMKHYPSTSL